MARRATYFFDVFEKDSPYVIVAGANEILGFQTGLEPAAVPSFVKAYERMGYHVGLLTQEEAKLLDSRGVTPAFSWKSAAQQPRTVVTLPSGKEIVFLRLPSLPGGTNVPSKKTIAQLSKEIAALKGQYALVVALSDWGWTGEREYLGGDPEQVPDILLGGGRGSGMSGRIESNDRCVWIRSFDKGQVLSVVKIEAWPDRSAPSAWKDPESIKPLTVGLVDTYTDNPDVNMILQ